MDEDRLIERLRRIEALFAGATTDGEKIAAERAQQRILERLQAWEREAPPIEYRFTMSDMWSRKVFVALLRRYGIRPYRYKGQRYTTVMARVTERFVDDTLWPEFQAFDETLRSYLSEVTERVVSHVIHQDSSEAEVVEEPPQLTAAAATTPVSPVSSAPTPPPEREGEAPAASATTSTSANRERRKKRKKRKRR